MVVYMVEGVDAAEAVEQPAKLAAKLDGELRDAAAELDAAAAALGNKDAKPSGLAEHPVFFDAAYYQALQANGEEDVLAAAVERAVALSAADASSAGMKR